MHRQMVFKFRLHLELLLELGEMFQMRSLSALGQKRTSKHVRVMSALPPKADIGTQSRNVRFVPNADYQRSISPNTMSRELSIAGTSASMCPRVKKSMAPKCGYDGARRLLDPNNFASGPTVGAIERFRQGVGHWPRIVAD